jgi:CRP-like cAMP-binding protein
MDNDVYTPLFRNIERLVTLTEEQKKYVASLFSYRKLRKRQFLVQAGDVCKFETYVVTGALKCSIFDQEGTEHVLRFAIEDWWATDEESFLTGRTATLDIEATEDCELLQIDYASLQELYQVVPAYERFDRIAFQRSFIALQNRIYGLYAKSAEQRYTEFTRQYPVISQRFAQKYIASYLGVTPEHLSKLRKHIR